jgi:hypothetical protein
MPLLKMPSQRCLRKDAFAEDAFAEDAFAKMPSLKKQWHPMNGFGIQRKQWHPMNGFGIQRKLWHLKIASVSEGERKR